MEMWVGMFMQKQLVASGQISIEIRIFPRGAFFLIKSVQNPSPQDCCSKFSTIFRLGTTRAVPRDYLVSLQNQFNNTRETFLQIHVVS